GDESLTARVRVQVIELRLPETLGLDLHRMAGRLPEAALAILPGTAPKDFREGWRQMGRTIIRQFPAGELAEIRQDFLQRRGLKAFVKENAVQMCGHDDVGIGPQTLVAMTVVETVRDDFAGGLGDEYGQPVNHGEGDVEQAAIGMEAVSFHGESIL